MSFNEYLLLVFSKVNSTLPHPYKLDNFRWTYGAEIKDMYYDDVSWESAADIIAKAAHDAASCS